MTRTVLRTIRRIFSTCLSFASNNLRTDKPNQAYHFELHLKKCWVTLDPYFRLHTTILGMNVANCWKVCNYHGLFNGHKINYYSNEEQIMPIQKFSGELSFQLLAFADSLKKQTILLFLLPFRCKRTVQGRFLH
jgi:hypothetical protein